MKTSIVILTHNQLHITKLCLDSIRAFTGPSYETIVVDNGSSDGTTDFLRSQPDVKAIFNSENKGFAKGCNQGWEVSSGDCVLFLNNDTIVTPGWLEAMLEVLGGSAR
ncbi:glycosyltransferase family 2 protein [Cohnella faecalis]|nr:glycosyltransferase family 2 protein [Cohnella faecalis]